MGWTKVATIFFLLVLFLVIGIFGSHFGYQTDAELIKLQNLPQIVDIQQWGGGMGFIVTFDTGFKKVMSVSEIENYLNEGVPQRSVAGFLSDLAVFNIAGVPVWISGFFDILVILLLYLIVTSFTPFIPGG